MRLVCKPHGVGKGVVPGALVVDGGGLWITGRQRLDQRAFGRADPADQREGGAGRVIGADERCSLACAAKLCNSAICLSENGAPFGDRSW